MKKVLIIGPNFFFINESIADAFKAIQWEPFVEAYDDPIHPFKGITKWRHKFAFDKESLRAKSRAKYNQYILDRYQIIQPDLVFIYNGSILSTNTLDIFRTSSKLAVWMLDSVRHFPLCENHIDHVDAFFCFEQEDVNHYATQGKKAYFLPQACDEQVYFTVPSTKDIDILFVGNLYRYNKRIEYLSALIDAFPTSKIRVYGTYKPYYKNPLKWLFREHRDIYMNYNVTREEVNLLYNRSKIVINIHHEQSKNGANPKVFEICGSGAYQICDENPFIKALYSNDEIGLYSDIESFLDCVREALSTDNSTKAKAAQELVLLRHTFHQRIQQVLTVLYS